MWYVYMLRCSNGAFYTGLSDDIDRRFGEHEKGKGGHYTRYNPPKQVIYRESFQTRTQAEKREQQIKRWSRAKKLALVEGRFERLAELSKSRD